MRMLLKRVTSSIAEIMVKKVDQANEKKILGLKIKKMRER